MNETNDRLPSDAADDVRLTAYALGELSGDDLREIEALVASNESARRAVEEIRATASLVTAELGAAGGESLTPEQRARIASRAAAPTNVVPMRRLYWTAAAALIAGATAGFAASRSWIVPREDERTPARASDVASAIAAHKLQSESAARLLKEVQSRDAALNDANLRAQETRERLREAQRLVKETKGNPIPLRESGGGGGHAGDEILKRGMTAGGGGGGGGSSGAAPEGGKDGDGVLNDRTAIPKPEPEAAAKAGVKIEVPAPARRVAHDEDNKKKAPPKPGGTPGWRGPADPAKPAPAPAADPEAPPVAGGPATPGGGGPSAGAGGPATGGPAALDGRVSKNPELKASTAAFADYHNLTPAQKHVIDELFRSEVGLPKPSSPVTVRCISFQLDGSISVDGLVGVDGTTHNHVVVSAAAVAAAAPPGMFNAYFPSRDGGTAQYAHIEDNPFRLVKDAPLSTFGADVDTASYSNVRRFLKSGQLPPPGAVRIEEMVNYFPYDYAPPTDGRPFAVRVDVAGCPWKSDHRLVRIGIKGKVVEAAARPAANLVFLLDVSGSMAPAERLPLIVQSMKLLVGQLEARDRVAIVVYAGASGLALPSTSCEDKGTILAALDALRSGGSTNGAAGIQLAYDVATQNRIEGGVNRVILATDGDFNVGVSDESSLVKLIEEKRKTGVFLSVLGVGTDNFKEAQMEKLADHGNGTFAYVDTLKEGQKILVEQTSGTLVTIAKDVKFQVEFNPAQVGAWRLVGYENRVLAAEDFKNDAKDAGEIGAGHTVTALYEVVPSGVATRTAGVDPLRYQQQPVPAGSLDHELLTVKLRWKAPDSDVSTPTEVPVIDEGLGYSSASPDFKFAASVAAFGMCLRGSPHRGQANLLAVVELATEGAAYDPGGYRREFVELVKRAVELGAR